MKRRLPTCTGKNPFLGSFHARQKRPQTSTQNSQLSPELLPYGIPNHQPPFDRSELLPSPPHNQIPHSPNLPQPVTLKYPALTGAPRPTLPTNTARSNPN